MNKLGKAALIAALAAGTYLTYKGAEEVITRILVSNALDRKYSLLMQKMKNSLKGDKYTDPLGEIVREQCERLEALDLEKVKIVTADNTTLVGRYYPAEDPKRLIVAMHGWRGKWCRDFGALFDFWHENGCSVIYVDERGQGESGGEYMGFGTRERFDCIEWVKWINERNGGELPVYLCGVSMGATSVLMCEGMELPSNVRGIIADCGFTSANEIWRYVVEHNLHLSYRKREARANALCRRRLGYNADEYSTIDALRIGTVPVLFIHGTKDTFVPTEMTYRNYLACRAPRRILIVPGAEHSRSSWVDPDAYHRALNQFWAEFDN